jgi:hypothetical protein
MSPCFFLADSGPLDARTRGAAGPLVGLTSNRKGESKGTGIYRRGYWVVVTDCVWLTGVDFTLNPV